MMLLIVEITAADGTRDALVDRLHDLLADGGDGLLQYTIGLDPHDPHAVTVVEEWRDEAAHAAFAATSRFADFRSQTAPLYAQSPKSRMLAIHVPADAEPEPEVISLL